MKRTESVAPYHLRWRRCADYRLDSDGWFYTASTEEEEYDPTQEQGLLSEFARIEQRVQQALRRAHEEGKETGKARNTSPEKTAEIVLPFLRQFGFVGQQPLLTRRGRFALLTPARQWQPAERTSRG